MFGPGPTGPYGSYAYTTWLQQNTTKQTPYTYFSRSTLYLNNYVTRNTQQSCNYITKRNTMFSMVLVSRCLTVFKMSLALNIHNELIILHSEKSYLLNDKKSQKHYMCELWNMYNISKKNLPFQNGVCISPSYACIIIHNVNIIIYEATADVYVRCMWWIKIRYK